MKLNSQLEIKNSRTMTVETLKMKTGDQWEDDYKNRYIITHFVTSTECYFFLISKETGRIVGRLDVVKNPHVYGVPEDPPEPIYTDKVREALNITEDMVFIGNPADGHVGEDRLDKQKAKGFVGHCEPLSSDLYPEKGSGTYEHLKIQPWYFIEANQLSFLEGSIVKRVCRHGVKDGVKDIDKAIDELGKLREYKYGEFNISVYKDDDTEYSEMEDAPIGDAIKALSDKLKNDPEYCSTWKANIAMAFKDVISRITEGDEAPRLTLNEAFKVADKAAWEFLEKLKD